MREASAEPRVGPDEIVDPRQLVLGDARIPGTDERRDLRGVGR